MAWDISLPLLLVPIMLLVGGANGGQSLTTTVFLGAVLIIFWLPQHLLIDLVGRPKVAASPAFMLGMPSAKFYGIIGLLGLLLHQSRRVSEVRPSA